jgi:hypothetical protein
VGSIASSAVMKASRQGIAITCRDEKPSSRIAADPANAAPAAPATTLISVRVVRVGSRRTTIHTPSSAASMASV